MEKIRKRKAVFRVEFQVYSGHEALHNQMCDLIESQLKTLPESFACYTPHGGATVTMSGLAQVIPQKVRRIVR